MRRRIVSVLLSFLLGGASAMAQAPHTILAIHGGYGPSAKERSPELDKAYRAAMQLALERGGAILKQGGSALDAAEAAVKVLEDSPQFNAGKGAVFTHDGKNELDAAIMNGKDRSAGAVAGLTHVKNPISAARAVMEKSPHVFLIGAGAEAFAKEMGLEFVDPSYFYTERRWQQLQKDLEDEKAAKAKGKSAYWISGHGAYYGTVGAVTLDTHGNLAAATSTGGMSNKRPGRVGDSPIIGAGTYAENGCCAVSATGHGEYFIRYGVGREIGALVKYKALSIVKAAQEVLLHQLKPVGGEGGVIALDSKGHIALVTNTPGMYRASLASDGTTQLFLGD